MLKEQELREVNIPSGNMIGSEQLILVLTPVNIPRRLPGESMIEMVKRVPGVDHNDEEMVKEIAGKVERSRKRIGGFFN